MLKAYLTEYLDTVQHLVAQVPVEQVESIVLRLVDLYQRGGTLALVGNGGSASTASHIANDFQKCLYDLFGKPFRCLALTDSISIITAWANDTDYTNVFAPQVRTWLGTDDVLIAISGSGNSPNVLRAVEVAKEQGAYTIGLTGYRGGKLAAMAHESIIVPSENMQQIEDVHMILVHLFFSGMRERIAGRV